MPAIIRELGLQPYEACWQAMQDFTKDRNPETQDEIWLLEHLPVYTLGLNGKPEHVLNAGDIPVIQCDRGGQVTYHGPGQAVVYVLLNLQRLQLGIRPLVTLLEQTMIQVLADLKITAVAQPKAPGVYVDGNKIGSVGLRVKRHCSCHGLSLNNNMDLSPFNSINPCGFPNLQVTQLADFGVTISTNELAKRVAQTIHSTLYK